MIDRTQWPLFFSSPEERGVGSGSVLIVQAVEKRSPGRNTCQGAYGRSTSYSSHSSHRWSRTPMTACCQLA